MNGRTERPVVLDTNWIITRENPVSGMDRKDLYISVITRIELYAFPHITPEEINRLDRFLADVTVIPLTGDIERIATLIRRSGTPRPKLPDAIVAATAVALDAPLVTADDKLLNLSWPGLRTMNFAP